jgi:N6-L-threonylcarbamoyladenine synthase/protein kinase Bud32
MNSSSPFICLGIESTAHTFSVGIVTGRGEILGLVGDTYLPESGGLHPQKVVEHHYNCFQDLIKRTLEQAKISIHQINLIAFSQGPGLGPCLRIGAAVARTLALKLNIPIVGINHCIAHVEIGRLFCHLDDPVTLYVSGGNTIVSAFDSGRYQIFGETLDLPIGNMIDMVARKIGIPHPGGPRIEALAAQGKNYISLPYIVKGMDLSFSGLFTNVSKKIAHTNSVTPEDHTDLIFSLQETAFAMLIEVTERAIAHTEKKQVLLTGGVAANKKLQSMLRYVCQEHQIEFQVVPFQVAGDNGAMIAWTGILQFFAQGSMTITDTKINPKWRMDEVDIPWRNKPIHFDQNPHLPFIISNKVPSSIHLPEFPNPLSNSEILTQVGLGGEIIRRGAEAVLIRTQYMNRDVIVKYRLPKFYRHSEIDSMLRSKRTTIEFRTLMNLAEVDLPVPPLYDLKADKGYFIMGYIPGNRLKDLLSSLPELQIFSLFEKVGEIIGRIHKINYIHGDLTTSNILVTPNHDMYFIDFGLAQNSSNIEDKAMDLHLFNRVLQSTHGCYYPQLYDAFLTGYRKIDANADEIINQIAKIELRGRYIPKHKRRKDTAINDVFDDDVNDLE